MSDNTNTFYINIAGRKGEKRISSRVLEEMIQNAVDQGHRTIEIQAYGQHGIGGRLWRNGNEKIKLRIQGHSGQRTGSLGYPDTEIEIMGPASDDIGWLNAGAEITVHGNASNGVMNGGAQGKVYIGGDIGARGMTMTKHNPRFDPPELWVLGSAGDYFGEFMAGGIAVICGFNKHSGNSVLGYRPLVGMVGGKVFFRKEHTGVHAGIHAEAHTGRHAGQYAGEYAGRHTGNYAEEHTGRHPGRYPGGSSKGHAEEHAEKHWGEHTDFSEKDARLIPISDVDWDWLCSNLNIFLEKIKKKELFDQLSRRSEWQLIRALTPLEKMVTPDALSMTTFRQDVWARELGRGGLFGDLQEVERGKIPLITKGGWRRMVPVWEHARYKAPCQANCPTGIPVQERWHLIRNGLVDEAMSMGLKYTPFPATVCGYLCPSPCMASCTKNIQYMTPVNVRLLGQAGEDTELPEPHGLSGIPNKNTSGSKNSDNKNNIDNSDNKNNNNNSIKNNNSKNSKQNNDNGKENSNSKRNNNKRNNSDKKIAVIGAGPGGISAAWHLTLKGHNTVLFDASKHIGGKISLIIPSSRIPQQTLEKELNRVKKLIPDIRLEQKITQKSFKKIKNDFDFVVVAAGAGKPRMLPIPGIEHALSANDFLAQAKTDSAKPGKSIVIIGAGNVGCDVATEAHRMGAETITLIDVQKPASFGKEREDAEAVGATFHWPCFTKEISPEGLLLNDGELLEADSVIISIGDVPDTEFMGRDIATRNGFISVNDFNQTSDPAVFAIGDIVGPGLLTEAIGAGKRTAEAIDSIIAGKELDLADLVDTRPEIETSRVSLEYFNPMIREYDSLDQCGSECASCGRCRDCSICVHACPEGAIERFEKEDGDFEYKADPEKCIGCGFCKGACPCGIWDLVTNEPL